MTEPNTDVNTDTPTKPKSRAKSRAPSRKRSRARGRPLGPYISLDEFYQRLGYRHIGSCYNAIRAGTFAVPTVKIGRSIVAKRKDVEDFIASGELAFNRTERTGV